jgi:hypothetical protein
VTRSPRGALALGLVAGVLGVPGAAPARAACVNESLRTELGSAFLADCRAYEQVTPPYKEGFELLPVSYSRNGETAVLETYGAIAGTEGDSEEGLTAYVVHRTSGGWRTEALEPPGAAYPGQAMRAANADTGASLWQLHSREQSPLEVSLYSRSAGGTWTAIGPLFSPAEGGGEPSSTTSSGLSASIAATADYSHVVFSTPRSELDGAGHRLRWPLDATVGPSPSLYEYSGVESHTPTLVDVRGARGSTELLSRCGAVLGSGELLNGSTFNALSADGETIFLTPLPEDIGNGQCVAPEPNEPAVAEVYARVGGAATSSRSAATVEASARSAAACGAACASSVAADKLFEGASEDGSKVVFASTQALIDGASEDTAAGDGAVADERGSGCAVTAAPGGCNLYLYDMSTRALSLIAGGAEVLGVARVSADGSHVYFVAKASLAQALGGTDRVQTAPITGQPNLYVYDTTTRTTAFVATLNSEADSEVWRVTDQRPVQASAGEGRFLLFASRGVKLTRDDNTTQAQLFEYDSQTGELARISKGEVVGGEAGAVERGEKGELGYAENGNAVTGAVDGEALAEGEIFHGEDFHQPSGGTGIYIAPDGSGVAFASAGRLSPIATSAEQGCTSVYEFRTSGPGVPLSGGHVSLISDGHDVQPFRGQPCLGAQPLAMSPEATDVLFSTADPLAPSDTDGLQRDIYDARIDGGFAPAHGSDACTGEACRGPFTEAPEAQLPATTLQLPGSNAGPKSAQRATVRITAHRLSGHVLTIVLRTNAPGRVVLSGRGLRSAGRGVRASVSATLRTTLARAAARSMRGRRRTHVEVTLVFRSLTGSKATARLAVALRG